MARFVVDTFMPTDTLLKLLMRHHSGVARINGVPVGLVLLLHVSNFLPKKRKEGRQLCKAINANNIASLVCIAPPPPRD